MSEQDVTIAIINWNTKDLLRECLESIISAHPLVSHSVKVIDNHSHDGSQNMVLEEFPEVDLVENAGNLGFSAAANQALRQSSAKYVFLLNSDTTVERETIDVLFEHGEHNEEVAIIGPMLLNTDGSTQITGRNFPSFVDASMHAFLGIIWPMNPWSVKYKMLDWDRSGDRSVDWVSGAAMFIKRDGAVDVDFFDENFFMYVEDLDICYRLKDKGWQVLFTPDAKVVHHIGKSSEQSSTKMIVEHQKSMYRFYAKKYKKSWRRLLKPLILIGLFIRTLMLLAASNIQKFSAEMKVRKEKEM